jgi:hypothetical protein
MVACDCRAPGVVRALRRRTPGIATQRRYVRSVFAQSAFIPNLCFAKRNYFGFGAPFRSLSRISMVSMRSSLRSRWAS